MSDQTVSQNEVGGVEPDWKELAKISLDEFKNRRELEWKLALGFWAVLGSFTYWFIANPTFPPPSPCLLGWTYGLMCVCAVAFWMLPLQTAHAHNKYYYLLYMNKASNESCGTKAMNERCRLTPRSASHWKCANYLWFLGQVSFTLIFLSASWWMIVRRSVCR